MCILNLFKCSRVTLYCIEYEAAKKFIEQSIVLSNCFLTRVKYLVFIYETTAYLVPIVLTNRKYHNYSYCLYALNHVENEVCTLLFTLRDENPELEKSENTTH